MRNPASGRKPNSAKRRGVDKSGFPSGDLTRHLQTIFPFPSIFVSFVFIQA
jgi:hypothetical protein